MKSFKLFVALAGFAVLVMAFMLSGCATFGVGTPIENRTPKQIYNDKAALFDGYVLALDAASSKIPPTEQQAIADAETQFKSQLGDAAMAINADMKTANTPGAHIAAVDLADPIFLLRPFLLKYTNVVLPIQ